MSTIKHLLHTATKKLGSVDNCSKDLTTPTFRGLSAESIDAEILLAHVINQTRTYLYTYPEQILDSNKCSAFYSLIEKRCLGLPIAYITGKKEFWSLELSINENVLIPRADTETLVEQALACVHSPNAKVLELGTGSGAISLALAKERPGWNIIATDISKSAINLAKQNAQTLAISNITFIESDWFSSLPAKQEFDLILSNPPYIDAQDPHLKQGDLRYEPNLALVAKHHGLDAFQKIIKQTPNYLVKGGWLLLEHGYNQDQSISHLLQQAKFQSIACWQDLNQLNRVSGGRL